jgi:hypothetical protein
MIEPGQITHCRTTALPYTVSRYSASPREPAEFPTSVKEVVTLLGKSQMRGTAIFHRIFEGQRMASILLVQRSPPCP